MMKTLSEYSTRELFDEIRRRHERAAQELTLTASALRFDTGSDQVKRIVKIVCGYYGFTETVIRGPSRRSQYILPRFMAIYICRINTDESQYSIGRYFNNRDHASVHYAFGWIREHLNMNHKGILADLAEIQSRLLK